MSNLTRNTRGRLCLTGILLGWAMMNNVLAEKIYESVDPEGEVTFSDTPPPPDAGTSRQIELQSGPSAAQVQESRQQLQNLENRANEAGTGQSQGQSPASQPAMGYTPASGESDEDESSVYVEGGYAEERYRDERMREGAAADGRYQNERLREGTDVQMEERRMPAGVSRPAVRVR